ncbi:hypothetical protein [Neisseria meningitidis]|uniref:hypothetical protein n=1 Tax=Neisseria meningitidis TaxID=487 RepID=UPI0020C7E303|nr:hypothetical protein [Neisseria meningitidis]
MSICARGEPSPAMYARRYACILKLPASSMTEAAFSRRKESSSVKTTDNAANPTHSPVRSFRRRERLMPSEKRAGSIMLGEKLF